MQLVIFIIGAWNIISVVLEYKFLVSIYMDYPELSQKSSLPTNNPAKFGGRNNRWLSKLAGAYRGWVTYFTHEIALAGLGLALLYMTVLGFDCITWGYTLLQCVPEWVLGVLVAISGGIGIAGSRIFPLLRRRLGVECAGVIGMASLLTALLFCVVSIWLPGSPFDLNYVPETAINSTNATTAMQQPGAGAFDHCQAAGGVEYTSVSVLLAGIICARFGLWLADLSVTQILQENVEEEKRGVIGGVQTSLCSTLDLVKFVLVLFLPNPHTFGLLIILSFTAILCGALSLLVYAVRRQKLICCKVKICFFSLEHMI